jgi:hypothetical protein
MHSGHTATVFGATGQLGRYIVNRLGSFHVLELLHILHTDAKKRAKDVQLSFPIVKK